MAIKIPVKIGQKFNKLTILKEVKPYIFGKNKYRKVLCQCECGNVKKILYDHLKRENIKSCGCLRKKSGNFKHGMRYTRFYRIWTGMNTRCNNKNELSYKNYGGRGIKCKWKSFEDFKKDMYESYLKHKKNNDYTSIDRINNDLGYLKQNCRWATYKEQANNTRINHLITYRNKTQNLTQWSEELKINRGILWDRIKRYNWTIEKALIK